MESTRQQLAMVFRLAIGMSFFTFAWFVVQTFFPQFSPMYLWQTIIVNNSSTSTALFSMDWFPTPRNRAPVTPGGSQAITFQTPQAYQFATSNYYRNNQGGMKVDYVTYGASGTVITASYGKTVEAKAQAVPQNFPTQPTDKIVTRVLSGDRSLYVRNLSIYEYGPVRKGMTFIGEARESFFKNGSFPLLMEDGQGRRGIIGTAYATTDWTIPGWVRFTATIGATLPDNVACNLFFQSANVQPSTKLPLSVPFAVRCVK